MFSPADLDGFSNICDQISGEVADADGFVAIRKLIRRFGVRLISRPLLVEGMLASVEEPGSPQNWAVLVDSETYKFRDEDLLNERSGAALPSRLRNTIAHELVHALAFRPSQFGITFRAGKKSSVDGAELVTAIEQETERLSSRLLIPERALETLLKKPAPLRVEELLTLHRELGVSRYLLISRLNLLRRKLGDGYGLPDRMRNIAIGLARRTETGEIALKKWPLFVYFDRAITPGFLLRLFHEDDLLLRDVVPEITSLETDELEFEASAGLKGSLGSSMRIRLSFESGSQKPGTKDKRYLFLAQRI